MSVVGVSPDSPKSKEKFAKKLGLNFPILSDKERTLIEPCGVWVEKLLYGKTYWGIERTTFVVGPDGTILHVWNKVNPKNHATEVARYLRSM